MWECHVRDREIFLALRHFKWVKSLPSVDGAKEVLRPTIPNNQERMGLRAKSPLSPRGFWRFALTGSNPFKTSKRRRCDGFCFERVCQHTFGNNLNNFDLDFFGAFSSSLNFAAATSFARNSPAAPESKLNFAATSAGSFTAAVKCFWDPPLPDCLRAPDSCTWERWRPRRLLYEPSFLQLSGTPEERAVEK
jgi:hypothetical protein